MANSELSSGTQRRPRHMSLFMSIAVTFLIICLLLAFSSGLSLAFSTVTYRQEQNQTGLEHARYSAGSLRGHLTEYLGLMDLISADQSLSQVPLHYSGENSLWIPDALSVRASLLTAQANFGDLSIQNVLAYYPASSLLITGKTLYTENALSYFLGTNGLDPGFFSSLPVRRHGAMVTEDGSLWLTRAVYQDHAVFVYLLIQVPLESLYSTYSGENDLLYLYLDGQCIYPSPAGAPPPVTEAQLLTRQEHTYYAAGGLLEDVALSVSVMEDASPRLARISHFRNRGLVILAASLLVILALAFVFTYRIYLPIRNLLTNAMIVEPALSVSHALNSVEHTLQKLTEEKNQFADSVQAANHLIQGERLNDILRAPLPEAQELYVRFLGRNGFTSPDHTVSLTCIHHAPGQALRSEKPLSRNEGHYSMAWMLLDNYLSTRLHFSLLKYSEEYILLTDGTGEDDLVLIQQALAEYVNYFRDSTGEDVICTKTRVVASSEDLRQVLTGVPQEIENLRFYGENLDNSPGAAAQRKPFPTQAQLHTLNRLLESENYAEARSTTEQMLDTLFARNPDYSACIHRIQGLMMIILAGLHRGADRPASVEFADLEARICAAPNIEALREEMESILDTLFSENLLASPDSASQIQPMLDYLEENYADHDLSLSSLSQHFAMDESSVSRIFRQEMNMTFLECIQRIRVRRARELLSTESVKDTARRVGFWDAQALIRVFKKYEGITPGQFRDSIKTNT